MDNIVRLPYRPNDFVVYEIEVHGADGVRRMKTRDAPSSDVVSLHVLQRPVLHQNDLNRLRAFLERPVVSIQKT